MDSDQYKLQKLFRYLEWIAIILVAVSQLLWAIALVKWDLCVEASFAMLALSGVISLWTPPTTKSWYLQLGSQLTLICLAAALGARQYYYVIIYVLAAKAALALPRRRLFWFGCAVAAAHIASSQYSQYAMQHVHAVKRMPGYYRQLVLEPEADIYFIIGMITVLFLGRTIINERSSRAAERSLAIEIEAMAVKLERAKIARDIHDGLGHSLNATKIQLERSLKLLEDDQTEGVLDLLTRCHHSAGSALREVRRAARTTQDAHFSLKEAVNQLVEQISGEGELTFAVSFDQASFSQKIQQQLFYIIQESLNNVRKHAQATHVEIALTRAGEQITLCVKDNGKGFNPTESGEGFGRKGISERAASIGASVECKSIVGNGTEVIVNLPSG